MNLDFIVCNTVDVKKWKHIDNYHISNHTERETATSLIDDSTDLTPKSRAKCGYWLIYVDIYTADSKFEVVKTF